MYQSPIHQTLFNHNLRHICLHRRAGANQIPIAEGLVNTTHGWPEFEALTEIRQRINRFFTGVFMVPGFSGCYIAGMWCIMNRVVFQIIFSTGNRINFFANGQKCITETVELRLAFAFGGFDHDGTCYRE